MQKIFACLAFVFLFMFGCKSAASTVLPFVEISLTATDITYDIKQIDALVGQPIKLTLINDGSLEHDFSILEMLNESSTTEEVVDAMPSHDMSNMAVEPVIHVAAPIGGQKVLEFTPLEAGTYEYFCTVPGHKEAGMDGFLIVKSS
ncbi:MAG: putative cupredoxin-like copper-binding protein [Candidatus Promineifilaceae bacterium]|jgi:uncharacterized cupredoxin-like copper-binding protein